MQNIRFLVMSIVLGCITLTGQAQTASSANGTVTGTTSATNQGNAQSITFTSPPVTTANVNYSGDQTIRNVPSVSGSNLTTSNDTCMGSSSGSANVPGIGVGFGTTWVDENCKMLKNSRELWNMGMKAASMALMCNDVSNREALELTGYVCPQTARKSITSSAGQPVYTDPIIRARLGLAPLK